MDESINYKKLMSPIHYVTKRLRINSWFSDTLENKFSIKEPESRLFKFFKEKQIKAVTLEDK